jgi:DNA repair exonuclease SbcCD ATPase subunit
MNKSAFVAFRATPQEAEMLDTVASSRGTSRSEVLRRGLACETIASLRKERAAIQAKLVEIAEARARLGSFDDEIERAKNALQHFANAEEDRVDTWVGSGCVGDRPTADFGAHAKMEQNLHRALLAADNARTAKNSLDVREAAARKDLASNNWKLRDAAITQIRFEITQQSAEIAALQAQLEQLQSNQHGAYQFVQEYDEKIYADCKVRNPAFGFWRDGIEGLGHDPRLDLKAPDPADLRQWRNRFDSLMGE